jgi:hypothetical protein
MKNIKWIIATAWATVGIAVAADNVALQVTSQVGATNSFTTGVQVGGYIDSVYVSSPTNIPVTFTLATPKETIISATFTNSGNYRVRLQDCTSVGVAIAQYDRLMIMDALTLMATQTSGTNAIRCVLRIANALTP